MSNGCGCESGILKFIKPPYAKLFYTACVCHDDDYEKGGDSRHRRYADRKLYCRMVELVRRKCETIHPMKATWLFVVALIYYISVRIFGWIYYNTKNK